MTNKRSGGFSKDLETLMTVGTQVGLSDGELLRRFVEGRDQTAEVAFETLVNRHGPMVLNVCKARLGGDEHEAEDAFQAVFVVLARKAGSICDPDQLGGWLYRVATLTAQKAFNMRRRRDVRLEAATLQGRQSWSTDKPDRHLMGQEETALLHEEIGHLPKIYRDVVVFRYLEGLALAEIAKRIGESASTVGKRLQRTGKNSKLGCCAAAWLPPPWQPCSRRRQRRLQQRCHRRC